MRRHKVKGTECPICHVGPLLYVPLPNDPVYDSWQCTSGQDAWWILVDKGQGALPPED